MKSTPGVPFAIAHESPGVHIPKVGDHFFRWHGKVFNISAIFAGIC